MQFILKSIKENIAIILGLFLVCIVMWGVEYFCLDEAQTTLRAYIEWINTNIIGAIIILVLLDSWIKEKDRTKERGFILKKITAGNDILSFCLTRQIWYINTLVNPTQNSTNLPETCELKDLVNIFSMPSLYFSDNRGKMAYEYYFENQKRLQTLIVDLLLNIDFNDHWEFDSLRTLFLGYVSSAEWMVMHEGIKNDQESFRNPENNALKELVMNSLEANIINPGWNSGNVMTKYVVTLQNINFNIAFINDYRRLMGELWINVE